jgi:hypothetical protein
LAAVLPTPASTTWPGGTGEPPRVVVETTEPTSVAFTVGATPPSMAMRASVRAPVGVLRPKRGV